MNMMISYQELVRTFPRKKVKGTETREKVQDCKAQGMTQKQAAESLGMGIATIKRNWN